MRKLIVTGIVLVALWCGWWVMASTKGESATLGWLEERRAEGWQAEIAGIERGGFPIALRYDIAAPRIADPVTGLGVALDRLRMSTPAWWPGDVMLTLPDTPIEFTTSEGPFTLQTTQGTAEMNLHPGFSLQLEALRAASADWQLSGPDGPILNGDGLDADLTQSAETAETYTLEINANALSAGLALQTTALADMPNAPGTLSARITVQFDTPLDRSTLETGLPQPRQVTVERYDAQWGDLRQTLSGTFTVDAKGVPDGALDLRVENWRQVVDPNRWPQAVTMLGMLSNMGGDADTLNLKLTFAQGNMALGPIPLGPAPRLLLR